MRNLLYSFWSVFWRIAAVLIVNYVVTSVIANIIYRIAPDFDTGFKIAATLTYLPAALLYLLLALRQASSETCEPGSSSFHWRNTYFILAAGTALVLTVKLPAALLLPIDLLFPIAIYLPKIVFLILWPILSIRLAAFHQPTDDTTEATA